MQLYTHPLTGMIYFKEDNVRYAFKQTLPLCKEDRYATSGLKKGFIKLSDTKMAERIGDFDFAEAEVRAFVHETELK